MNADEYSERLLLAQIIANELKLYQNFKKLKMNKKFQEGTIKGWRFSVVINETDDGFKVIAPGEFGDDMIEYCIHKGFEKWKKSLDIGGEIYERRFKTRNY